MLVPPLILITPVPTARLVSQAKTAKEGVLWAAIFKGLIHVSATKMGSIQAPSTALPRERKPPAGLREGGLSKGLVLRRNSNRKVFIIDQCCSFRNLGQFD